MLTLSFGQVACERSFNYLKNIKSKLRSSMNQDKHETFILMAFESDILDRIKIDDIIDKVAQKSKELKELLII